MQEQASIQQQLELMQTDKVLTEGWLDTTAESKERAMTRLTELQSGRSQASAH